MKMIITLVVVGFIPTLLFSWAYELTPEGLKKDSEVDKSASDTSQTTNRLSIVTLVAVAGTVALVGWQQMKPPVSAPVSDQSSVRAITQNPSAEPELGGTVTDASIAILPFADLSPEGDQGYFSDGVSEEILNVLVKIKGLRVASRTSGFAYKNSQQRNPDDANLYNWRATFWAAVGFIERAFADYDTCLRLDPSYLNCGYNKHSLLIVSGKEDEAVALHRSLMLRGTNLQAYNPLQPQVLIAAIVPTEQRYWLHFETLIERSCLRTVFHFRPYLFLKAFRKHKNGG